ncbi:proteasome assembly chaperone 1 isoform X1 [Ictalurus furcatus]|uniref:proteasome assembly chaperone 1 isoform X1 n=1 Tax=Ictalurus furcatus TaxID=66913 RepID=UPI0023508AA5|nr:proteasome assembly chaperone 1 isoform X1 [Ictalurus furcatus]
MATFFGEVLSVYSRAVEEDDYDDAEEENEEDLQIRREIEEKREVHIKWCPEVSKAVESSEKLQCSDLIIAVGPNAAGFVSAYILSSEGWTQVGWVSLWNERSCGSTRLDTAPLPGEPGCVFYQQRSCPSVLICQCTCYIAEDQLFQWAEKVLGSMQSRGLTVTVLSDSPLAEYKTPHYVNGNATPFLRALKTSTFTDNLHCPLLEQPNIITGLPAAVLNQCQVQHVPAVLFQCFSDVIHPDSVTMETYKPTLSCLRTQVKLDTSPNMEILQKLTRVNDAHGNLYT